VAACGEPVTAHQIIPVLFRRTLDDFQLMFAMGEAIAHLHYLQNQGVVRRFEDDAGVRRFARK